MVRVWLWLFWITLAALGANGAVARVADSDATETRRSNHLGPDAAPESAYRTARDGSLVDRPDCAATCAGTGVLEGHCRLLCEEVD